MEVVLLLLLLIIFVFIIYSNNRLAGKLGDIHSELAALKKEFSNANKQPLREEKKTAAVETTPVIPEQPQQWESGFKVIKEEKSQLPEPAPFEKGLRAAATVSNIQAPPKTIQAPLPPRQSFLERHPDLEGFIGENITSKIGIGILVLAIGFFVKYAIDNEWINEAGRVGIGLLCGAILTLLAHRMRNNYAAFSSVLLGGGLAIFYFTITLAYHEYHLFSQTITFIIMVAITAFAVILSQLYNRQELAVIALIGGFATPFMASSGSGNFKALFIYLIILNTGLLAISYFKTWRILNLLAFVFTVILFGGWMLNLPAPAPAETSRAAIVFATIFYLLFVIINIAHNIKENKRFLASDFGIILSNTCLYFTAVLYFIDELNADIYRGLFTASLALFNLVLSYLLYLKRRTDPNILYLLIGITCSLVSLTAPIQLEGNYITFFWATETVLLYWLYQKSGIKIIRLASLFVWVALLVSIFMDWLNYFDSTDTRRWVVFNKGFITLLFSSLACFAIFYLRLKDSPPAPGNREGYFPEANTFFLTGVIILFSAGFLEVSQQYSIYYPEATINTLYILAYTFAFIIAFDWVTNRYAILRQNKVLAVILLAVVLLINLLTLSQVFELEIDMLTNGRGAGHFVMHWIAAMLIGLIIYRLVSASRQFQNNQFKSLFVWLICAYIIVFLSTEGLLVVNMLFYRTSTDFNELERVYVKSVLPILWGVCSFAFMWIGMKYKFRTLRIISLVLFTIILAKLFLYDIRDIPVAGKIAAFFCLGVLLLIISFMYQRVKRIIVQGEVKEEV